MTDAGHRIVNRFLALALLLPLATACGDDDGASNDNNVNNDNNNNNVVVGSVVINEVDCHGRDWVEVVNPTAQRIDLGGWVVSDDPTSDTHRYAIPAGTFVEPGGWTVIKQQDLAATDPLGFTFGLKCGTDTLVLLKPDGQEADRVVIGTAPDGSTWGRLPDATGAFQETSPTQGSANQPPTAVLFDPLVVSAVDITVDTEAYASLLAYDPLDAATQDYVTGDVQVTTAQGTFSPPSQVGIRLKSGNAFRPITEKASFKVKIAHLAADSRLLALKGFTLNNMVDDPTMMRETLGYAMFRQVGVPALRSGYARVTVNGEDYGLYVLLERYDDDFVQRSFASWAHVYEGSGDLDATSLIEDRIQVDEGDAIDTADLEALVDTIALTPDGTWMTSMGSRLDLDLFARLWALENYLGHWDGYAESANNYYLHSDAQGRFTMMPWGLDRAFVEQPAFPTSSSVLCERCLGIPACVARYDTALATVKAVVAILDLDPYATQLAAVIGPEAQTDPRMESTYAEHQQAVTELRAYLTSRAAAVP